MSEYIECPEWLLPSLLSYTKSDEETWKEWTSYLPRREVDTPYTSGPHSVKNFTAFSQLGFIYGKVFEIGFCLGHSASAFLECGAALVHSQEISMRPETLLARDVVKNKWQDRFEYNVVRGPYDVAYIDGDHSVEAVDADVRHCLDLGISKIIFDDFYPHWGPGTQPAIRKYNLKIKAIIGGMATCTKE